MRLIDLRVLDGRYAGTVRQYPETVAMTLLREGRAERVGDVAERAYETAAAESRETADAMRPARGRRGR